MCYQFFHHKQKALADEICEYDKFEQQYFAIKPEKQNIFVDIGEKCFMQAEVEGSDVLKAFVHIGLGIHVQFDDKESLLPFLDQRRAFLQQKIVYLTTKIEIMQNDIAQVSEYHDFTFHTL